jgi:hypothetical protein
MDEMNSDRQCRLVRLYCSPCLFGAVDYLWMAPIVAPARTPPALTTPVVEQGRRPYVSASSCPHVCRWQL